MLIGAFIGSLLTSILSLRLIKFQSHLNTCHDDYDHGLYSQTILTLGVLLNGAKSFLLKTFAMDDIMF